MPPLNKVNQTMDLKEEIRLADRRRWPWLLIVALIATVGLFIIGLSPKESEEKETQTKSAKVIPLEIVAQSAIVVDLNSGEVLYQKNPDQISVPASLTKLLTVFVANKYLDPNTEVIISPKAIQQEGDSGLIVGEYWKLAKLTSFTLVNSSNDGAAAIAETLENQTGQSFVRLMNDEAVSLGMNSSIFANPTGLDFDSHGDGALSRTTARDIAEMVKFLFETQPDIFKPTTQTSYQIKTNDNWHLALNTNHKVRRWPGLLGSKTGYTDMAGGNLATIIDAGINQPIITVVLGSTIEGRFNDTEILTDFARQKIADPSIIAL